MASRFCPRCGQLLPTNATNCPRCNAPVPPAGAAPATGAAGAAAAAPSSGAPPETATAVRRTCPNCRAAMRWIGHYSLRATSSTAPAGSTVAPAEGPEHLLPFSLYYCQSCGKFDFYYPGT